MDIWVIVERGFVGIPLEDIEADMVLFDIGYMTEPVMVGIVDKPLEAIELDMVTPVVVGIADITLEVIELDMAVAVVVGIADKTLEAIELDTATPVVVGIADITLEVIELDMTLLTMGIMSLFVEVGMDDEAVKGVTVDMVLLETEIVLWLVKVDILLSALVVIFILVPELELNVVSTELVSIMLELGNAMLGNNTLVLLMLTCAVPV